MNRLTWFMWGSIGALAVLLAVISYFAWPRPEPEPKRAREFRDYDICLLTGQEGITSGPAAAAWSGMDVVSRQTDVRRAFLQVSGEQTETRARQFVATLVQQRCGIIVAIGQPQVAAANALAAQYPAVKFVPLADTVTAEEVTAKVRPLVPAP